MNNIAANAGYAPVDLDAIDQGIIELLRSDGRMPYRAIARELNITESTVRARVKRLEETDTMRVVAVTDTQAAGFGVLLAIGVQVENRGPEEVARDLAKLPQVFSVNVVVGTQDVEILVVAEDQEDVNALLSETLSAIPGVRKLTPAVAVDVLKNQPDWVPFYDG